MSSELPTDAMIRILDTWHKDLWVSVNRNQLQALLDENKRLLDDNEGLRQSLKSEARIRRDDVVRWQEQVTKYRNLYLQFLRLYGDEAIQGDKQ